MARPGKNFDGTAGPLPQSLAFRFAIEAMDLSDAYAHCRRITEGHYENFPVASRLMPSSVRPAIWATYAFARGSDDIADEGDAPPRERLDELSRWGTALDSCLAKPTDDPVFLALGDTLRRHNLPIRLYHDLLSAFSQDVTTTRYENFEDVLDYCRRSANPVGRIVLWLSGYRDERRARFSDMICTALQLANFWQDVSVDIDKDRLYIPLEDMTRFGINERDILERRASEGFRALLRFQIERTRRLFEAGRTLPERVRPPLRWELRLVWLGGMRIMDHVEAGNYDTLAWRPTVTKTDWLRLLFRACLPLVAPRPRDTKAPRVANRTETEA